MLRDEGLASLHISFCTHTFHHGVRFYTSSGMAKLAHAYICKALFEESNGGDGAAEKLKWNLDNDPFAWYETIMGTPAPVLKRGKHSTVTESVKHHMKVMLDAFAELYRTSSLSRRRWGLGCSPPDAWMRGRNYRA